MIQEKGAFDRRGLETYRVPLCNDALAVTYELFECASSIATLGT